MKMRWDFLGLTAMLALMMIWPVTAQDTTWEPLAFSGDNVVFVLGGPETRDGDREVTLAVVPSDNSLVFGEEIGYFLNFYTVNCTERISRHHTVHVFGPDGNIVSQEHPDQPAQAVPNDASAMDLAVRLKCRSDPPSVSGAVVQSRLMEAAKMLRDATGG